MMRQIKANWSSWLVLAAMIAVSLWLAPDLPDRVATHFDWRGQPDQYGSKTFALTMMPAVTLLLVLGLPWLVKVSPNGYQMEHSGPALTRITFATALLMASIHIGMLLQAVRPDVAPMASFIAGGLALFMIILGNVLGKAERNFFVGIRTPWTLTSDDNWRATHRLAGKLFVGGGLVGLASLPTGQGLWVTTSILVAASLATVAYSFLFYRRTSAGSAAR